MKKFENALQPTGGLAQADRTQQTTKWNKISNKLKTVYVYE